MGKELENRVWKIYQDLFRIEQKKSRKLKENLRGILLFKKNI